MDFDFPSQEDPRRLEVRAWFAAHPEPSGQQWLESGFTVPHWPKPWGLEADAELQLIIDEEISRAGLMHPAIANPVAINNCAQSLLTHGTPEQQERYLKPALALEEMWCMLFSEPSGGSDLGSLRTVARKDGDNYIVNGQKIWTSLADKAQIGVLVARTDAEAPKHKGLSQFLISMDMPGITIQPIVDMSGYENEYNEVFFDDVVIPANQMLGSEGEGFALSMLQLQTERVALSKPGAIWGAGPSARELLSGLADMELLEDAVVRDEAAKIYIEGEILRLLSYRSLSDRMNAAPPGPEGAIRKMVSAPHGQDIMNLAKKVQGPDGLLVGAQPFDNTTDAHLGPFGNWDYAYWFSPAVTLGVGTQEVLKNVVAERMLGLPRDPDPSAKLPWSESH